MSDDFLFILKLENKKMRGENFREFQNQENRMSYI